MPVDAMSNDLGISLRCELITGALQLLAQLFVVLDDPIVNDGDPIPRDVRVRVSLAGHAVCGPTCMCDPNFSGSWCVLQSLIEHPDLAYSPKSLQMLRPIENSDARRVIPPVLEPM